MNIKHLAQAATLATLGFAGTALADHDDYYDDRRYQRVVSSGGYANRHAGAQYAYARVLSVQPIVRKVKVKRPVRQCYRDVEYYSVDRPARGTGANTLVGAIVGGVVGHQFGSGRGNDAATVAGTLIGAAIANDAAQRRYGYETVEHARPVERCKTKIKKIREERIDGYHVVYRFNGQKYATRMPYDPGREIRVRVDVRPVG